MKKKIEEKLKILKNMGDNIKDEEKIIGYLEKVGFHRLNPYFHNTNNDIEKTISYYIFDKRLRFLILDMLEVIENGIKGIIINHIGEYFYGNDFWYTDTNLYQDQYVSERLSFIEGKIEYRKQNDNTVKTYFRNNPDHSYLPDYLYFDKLTFGELIKTIKDFTIENQKYISSYFQINGQLFVSWIFSLTYLRNLCSHYENIYNRKMTMSIKSELIKEILGNQNTFLSYMAIISLFNRILLPNFKRHNKIIELMKKFNILTENIGLQTKNLPSELESEAWEVLIDTLYTKYIKKSNNS